MTYRYSNGFRFGGNRQSHAPSHTEAKRTIGEWISTPNMPREGLLKFAEALGSAANPLRRDECGDPCINGRREHIYACPDGYRLYVVARSTQAWTWAKKDMAFACVEQDGDEEGVFAMDRLPTADEAELIRHYVGVTKRPDLSAERIAALSEMGTVRQKTALAA
jgi:hypothetical protein